MKTVLDCRVVVAAGSMECPGFAHADFNEDRKTRLSGAIGLRLPAAEPKLLMVMVVKCQTAKLRASCISAYAASGYWNDDNATQRLGEMAGLLLVIWVALPDGRLRLMGRRRETINRSGLKILPAEVEQELLDIQVSSNAPLLPPQIRNMGRCLGLSFNCNQITA